MKRKRGQNSKRASKLQRIEKDGNQSYFKLILENPGFHFIFEEIFSNLNSTDLAKCHRVSKRFHSLLNKSKQWWISQLKFIRITPKTFTYWKWDRERKFKKQEVIDEKFPSWRPVFEYFQSKVTLRKLKTFVCFMKRYHKYPHIGTSPSFYAIANDRRENIFKLILESPIDMQEREYAYNISTLLHFACFCNQKGVVKLLLERNFDVNHVNLADKEGVTPLHEACTRGHLDIVKILLRQPNINYLALDVWGQNIIHYCHKSFMLRFLVGWFQLCRGGFTFGNFAVQPLYWPNLH